MLLGSPWLFALYDTLLRASYRAALIHRLLQGTAHGIFYEIDMPWGERAGVAFFGLRLGEEIFSVKIDANLLGLVRDWHKALKFSSIDHPCLANRSWAFVILIQNAIRSRFIDAWTVAPCHLVDAVIFYWTLSWEQFSSLAFKAYYNLLESPR